eukprot:805622-Prorocentrum_minimum.AAC.1
MLDKKAPKRSSVETAPKRIEPSNATLHLIKCVDRLAELDTTRTGTPHMVRGSSTARADGHGKITVARMDDREKGDGCTRRGGSSESDTGLQRRRGFECRAVSGGSFDV